MADSIETDVLIVGGGPVGMACALELGLRGDAVVLAERDATRGPQPRAKTLNMRSLAHMRRWGIADAVRAASPLPDGFPTDIIFQTRLFGHHIATLPNIYFRGNTGAADPRFSEPSEWIPQYLVEGVMGRKLDTLPTVDKRFGSELISFVQDDDGVTARLHDAVKGEYEVRSRYLVGADGGRSRVREALGFAMTGRYAYSCNYNLVLRIPELAETPPSPQGIMHWTINEDSPGVLGPMGDVWYFAMRLPEGATTVDDAEIKRFVTGAIGREVAFEVVTLDPWYAHELIADRYRNRRVFLAGDACHLHPPFGGYGMNMGIADAVDVGWKLSAVLAGWAGDALLDSYEWERRRVHQWTIDESVANYALLSADLVRPDLDADTPLGETSRAGVAATVVEQKRREFHTIGLVLGYHYSGSPVVAEGEPLPPPRAETYDPIAAPGVLAPHLWLAPGVSLYDRLGPALTLLCRSENEHVETWCAAARTLDISLRVLALPTNTATLYPSSLTLVRPDEHVIWVGDDTDPASAIRILERATGRSTTRPAACATDVFSDPTLSLAS